MQQFHLWMLIIGTVFSVWFNLLVYGRYIGILADHLGLVLLLPFIALILFGLYATAVVLYRVFTFNDCEEAAAELQKQIVEAKADLTKKGFKFVK